jgi:glycine/D-amino acid oxidase-like deaminating enzyme
MVRRRVLCGQCGDQVHHSQQSSSQSNTTNPQDEAQILPVPHPTPSYWLSEPHAYANLRSTSCLPRECDVAIIGSGMAGVMTAYHILEKSPDLHVVLLDARALCSGATGRNGGHIKVQTATLAALPTDEERNAMQAFLARTIRHVKTIVDKEGLAEYCEFELRHSFDVFCDSEAVAKVKSVYDESVKNGAEWTMDVSYLSKKMAERVTSIKGAEGGFSVQAASFWPYKFVAGVLGRLVERHGETDTDDENKNGERKGNFNVQMNTPVTRISTSNPSPDNETSNLHTPRGTLSASKLVFATNAWTAGLLPAFTHTIIPRKGMASQ